MNIQEALAAVRANPPHEESPLPWANDDEGALYCRSGYQLGRAKGHARHIRAAVNAAPVLAAEVERLQGLLAAARVAVGKMPAPEVQDVPPDPAMLMDALHGAVHKDEGPENRGRLQLRSLKTEVPQ